MQYENTNSMDNQSMNNTIHSPVDDVPKAPKSNNTFKLATIALAIVTLVLDIYHYHRCKICHQR